MRLIKRFFRTLLATGLSLATLFPAYAENEPVYGPELEGFTYPYPVEQFRFRSHGASLHMAYMDVKPS